jgi:serine/threonine protein kinase
VPGRSLQARVDEDGPLSVEEILRIGLQAAAGLAAAHAQGLVHRDVKPSNILLEDGVERAVLTDFGLARAMDDASLTQTGILAGTPSYMSPEQATGAEIDARSDLFSLGAVLYFMATGRPPFRAEGALAVLHRICQEKHRPVWQLNKDVPDELCDVIDRLLEKKPARRMASAIEVHRNLSRLLSRVQLHGLGRRASRRWRARNGRRIVLAGVALLATILAISTAFWWTSKWQNTSGPFPLPKAMDAEAVAGREMEFFTTLKETRDSMDDAARGAVYLRNSNDGWRREIESLKRDLDKAETDNR